MQNGQTEGRRNVFLQNKNFNVTRSIRIFEVQTLDSQFWAVRDEATCRLSFGICLDRLIESNHADLPAGSVRCENRTGFYSVDSLLYGVAFFPTCIPIHQTIGEQRPAEFSLLPL